MHPASCRKGIALASRQLNHQASVPQQSLQAEDDSLRFLMVLLRETLLTARFHAD
jgi:hypothetical protein